MEHQQNTLILVLEKGEDIIPSILNFASENKIFGAWISGLGALSKATIAIYNLENKKYITKSLEEPLEIASMVGNIAQLKKQPIEHIHVVLSDKNFKTYAGHLKQATVSATCEIKLELFDHPIKRNYDKKTGLNLINFKE